MRMKPGFLLLAAAAMVTLSLPALGDEKKDEKGSKMHKTASGLQYEDTVVGTGPSPQAGQICAMHYTGWL